MVRFRTLVFVTILFVVVPGMAGIWYETSLTDFSDGIFNANVYIIAWGKVKSKQDAIYDLNEDGHPDIIVCNMHDNYNFNTPSFIYWGSDFGYSANNRTELPTIGATGNSVADLNEDGYLDIVFSSYTTEENTNSSIYWGSANGYSSNNVTYLPTKGAHGNYVADLNDDRYLDIIFANYGSRYYHDVPSYIYWGSASGYSPSNRTMLPTHGGISCSVADLNDDGHLDIVFSNRATSEPNYNIYSYIYWGSSSGYSPANKDSLYTEGAYGNAIADLNGDSYLDIVFCNHYNGSSYCCNSYIYWGNASGFSNSNKTVLPTLSANSASVADLNKDGYSDIVFANWRDDISHAVNSYIYWGSSNGYSITNRTELPTYGATGVMIGKVSDNGSGGGKYLDIVFTGLGESYIYYGSESGYSPSNLVTLPCTYGHLSTKNIGNVENRSGNEYYYSSVFDAGVITDWNTANWTADVPVGASLNVMVRTGNMPIPDATWSEWQNIANGSEIPDVLNSRYIQYQVVKTRNDLLVLPSLDEISITYTPLGVEEKSTLVVYPRISTVSSPRGKNITINYQLPVNGFISLKIYGVNGNLIKTLISGEEKSGAHSITWNGRDHRQKEVGAGVYFIHFVLGEYNLMKKIVLIK